MISVFFKTYGCQANVADSEGLMRYLSDLGCAIVSVEREADVIIVNSCAVREKAEQKMFSYLGRLVEYKQLKPHMKMGVIGCVASYRKKEMKERFSHIDFVFGARENIKEFQAYLFDLITALETVKQLAPQEKNGYSSASALFKTKFRAASSFAKFKKNSEQQSEKEEQSKPVVALREAKKSFINIMTGCNNYCSFCIVPFTRGREKSFSLKEIVQEVEREIIAGSKEIMLIGQNVNSYRDPENGASFAALLEAVAQIPGEFWVRFVSPHPKDMTRDVLEVMARFPEKLCKWVHMPLQSGSDRILLSMNRPYSRERYMEIIGWIHELLPGAAITSDIIVGFPGEEELDYLQTLDVMKEVRYCMSYSFVYSKRKYTKAFSLPDDVSYETKQKRLHELQELQKELCLEYNNSLCGQKVKVLVEKRFSHDKLLARTEGNVRVLFEGPDQLVGRFVEILITTAGPVNLEGTFTEHCRLS